MVGSVDAPPAPQFEIRLPDGRTQSVTRARLRTLIHTGGVNPTTKVRSIGSEEWTLAGDVDALRGDFESAATGRESVDADSDRISRLRLVSYMALAGLVAGGILMILSPLCLIVGIFAKFVIGWAAFGAVLGLGVTNATRIESPRVIQVTAAGFAAGGLVSWFFHSPNGEFTPLHFAIIGLIGGAALSYAIQLPKERAIAVTAAATILFPAAIYGIKHFTPGEMHIPSSLTFVALPVLIFVPFIPFAIFGGILGSLINWSQSEPATRA